MMDMSKINFDLVLALLEFIVEGNHEVCFQSHDVETYTVQSTYNEIDCSEKRLY